MSTKYEIIKIVDGGIDILWCLFWESLACNTCAEQIVGGPRTTISLRMNVCHAIEATYQVQTDVVPFTGFGFAYWTVEFSAPMTQSAPDIKFG